ncbi:DUF4328 domain-containing protein [Actinokineospora sp. NPDC004072]
MSVVRSALLPVSGARWTATALIAVACAAGVASTWAHRAGYFLVEAYLEDRSVSYSEVLAGDERTQVLAWVYFGALVVAGVGFVGWLWRAWDNAARLTIAPHRHGRGWVVGSWLVPVVNLWFPYQVVRDVWRGSRPDARGVNSLDLLPGSAQVNTWWALWIAAVVADRVLVVLMLRDVRSLDGLRTAVVVDTVATLLLVAAGAVLFQVMGRISGWQEQARLGVG